jgi:hypothetical protein
VAINVLLAASAAVAVAAKNGGGGAGRETGVVVVRQKNWFKRVHAILSKYDQVHYLTGDYLCPQDLKSLGSFYNV